MQIHKSDKKHFIIDFNLLFYYCFFFPQTIQVFGNVLCGNLDGACFRYMMLMCDFITVVEWKEVEDFRAFAHVVYPFMGVSFWSSSLLLIITGLFLSDGIIHVQRSYSYTRIKSITHKILKILPLPPPQQIKTRNFIFMVTQFLWILWVYPLSMN